MGMKSIPFKVVLIEVAYFTTKTTKRQKTQKGND